MGMSNKIQNIFTDYFKESNETIKLPPEMWRIVENILECRTPAMDIHFEECPEGHGVYVLYDSCKHRGCPQCQEIENQKWLQKKKQVLLPGSHIQLVFKLPVNLSRLWLYNKSAVANSMFKAVGWCFKKLQKKDGVERGIILVFHSNGKGLSYHPHVHCLVTFGGFTKDERWDEKRISYEKLEEVYRNRLQKELVKVVKSNGFVNPPGMKCLDEIINRSSGKWKIFESEVYKTGEGVLTYLSRHMKSGVISEREIVDYNKDEVIFKDGHGSRQEIYKLKTEEFVLRYLNHVPVKNFRVVRNMGLYSSRKVEETKEYKKSLGVEIEEKKWEMPKRRCPECGREVEPVSEEDKKKLKKYCERRTGEKNTRSMANS